MAVSTPPTGPVRVSSFHPLRLARPVGWHHRYRDHRWRGGHDVAVGGRDRRRVGRCGGAGEGTGGPRHRRRSQQAHNVPSGRPSPPSRSPAPPCRPRRCGSGWPATCPARWAGRDARRAAASVGAFAGRSRGFGRGDHIRCRRSDQDRLLPASHMLAFERGRARRAVNLGDLPCSIDTGGVARVLLASGPVHHDGHRTSVPPDTTIWWRAGTAEP